MVIKQLLRYATITLLTASCGAALATETARPVARDADDSGGGMIERGRYLVRVAGCNDCHTPGYAQTAGKVPEREWLVGDQLGWHGPWGTTYATNLRIALSQMSEDQWLSAARSNASRPPMPWFGLRDMADDDLRAIYRFIRSLGVAGSPAPAYVPPGKQPTGVTVLFPMPPT